MTDHDVQVQLEGWLPGDQKNGLPSIGAQLMDLFDQAYDTEDDTATPTLTLVVGLVKVVGVKRRENPDLKPPVVATRFVHIEVVKPGEDYQAVRDVLTKVADKRNGQTPLPLDGDAQDEQDEIANAKTRKAAMAGKQPQLTP